METWPPNNGMLTDNLLQYIRKHGMLAPGDTVLVAVSGGADSVALLHALWSLRKQLDIDLYVAHLNHGIRGKHADEDADFVAKLADEMCLPCVIEKADVPAVKKTLRLSMEEAARKVRYEFLGRTADSVGAARIATAHTSDDQAETVLMNLIRGAGIEGLSGIPPVRGKCIRPLLSVSRKEVEDYCAESHLQYRTDASNLRPDYRRNKIRLQLLPLLESEYNPAVKSALASTADILREEASFLADAASTFLKVTTLRKGESEVVLHLSRFVSAPNALRRRCLRMAVEIAKGDLRDVEFKQVERILTRLDHGNDFTLTLPSGVIYAAREGGTLRIYRVDPEPQAPEAMVELPVPGRMDISELAVTLAAEELTMPADYHRPPRSTDVVIDRDKVQGRLFVRNWRKGDRIRPLGMNEDKKLQDLFVDLKIPRSKRPYVPIVADEEKIIWVAGVALSELVKITSSTTRVLNLRCEPVQK